MLEQPGPPLNHEARGAVEALLRASKNLQVLGFERQRYMNGSPKPHVHVGSDREISGVLAYTWGGLANTRVLDVG